MICWGPSTSCFIYSFVIQVISEKTLCSKGSTSNLRDIFILFLSFLKNQNQESRFQQVGGLVARNISVFSL